MAGADLAGTHAGPVDAGWRTRGLGQRKLPGVRRRAGPRGTLRAAGRALQRGDAHARWPGLVVPVDTPLLPPRLLQQLRDGHRGPCTIFAGHPLPMLVDIDDACRNVLESMLGDPDGPRSLQALQRRLGVNSVALAPVDEAGLVNCNTPEQWEDVAS